MNKKLVLATVATIAAVATAQGVKADETNVQATTGTGNEASTVTAPAVGKTGAEKTETTIRLRLVNLFHTIDQPR